MPGIQMPDLVLAALLVVASIIDVRRRILPDPLACSIVSCSALSACMADGAHGMAMNLFWGALTGFAVVLTEMGWRHAKGSVGIGGGDIKLLVACMARDPQWALASFCAGLIALAMAGCALSRRSLPFIPFFTLAGLATMPQLAGG